MFTWLKRLFAPKPKDKDRVTRLEVPRSSLTGPKIVDQDGNVMDDALLAFTVQMCMDSGDMVFANVDANDIVTIETVARDDSYYDDVQSSNDGSDTYV